MSDSDDSDAPETVPSDEYGVIYTEAANLEAGRAPDFGRRGVDAARLRDFDEVRQVRVRGRARVSVAHCRVKRSVRPSPCCRVHHASHCARVPVPRSYASACRHAALRECARCLGPRTRS